MITLKSTIFLVILLTSNAVLARANILNQNFESDVIPLDPGYTTRISGWVSSGTGRVGVNAPIGSSIHYHSVGNQVQVAYLDKGGRLSQATDLLLTRGQTYSLTFDAGQRLDQTGSHFVARIKADGLILAQIHSNRFNLTAGHWHTQTLSFNATSDMPAGKPIIVEFQNLATTVGYQANIDNINLTESVEPVETIQNSQLTTIYKDTTLSVPNAFSDINAALKFLQNKHIKPGKIVTIKVDDCNNQIYNRPIDITHPNGNAIQIIGNTNDPSQCVLQFNNSHGIKVTNGYALGLINGFKLQGNNQTNKYGLFASKKGLINSGTNMIVTYFSYGLYAENNANIFAQGITVTESEEVGIYAKNRALIYAPNSTSRYNHIGFLVDTNATMETSSADASYNTSHGFQAQNGSFLHTDSSQSEFNGGNGYSSINNSYILNSHETNALHNTEHGFYAGEFSTIIYGVGSNNGVDYSPTERDFNNNNAYKL